MRRILLIAIALGTLASCTGNCSGSTSSVVESPTPVVAASPTAVAPVRDASCDAESTSHSLNSNTPTSYTFVNHTSVALSLFWLNFQGQRIHYQDVPAGQTRGQATFITHPWVMADPAGNCIRLFLVTTPDTITVG